MAIKRGTAGNDTITGTSSADDLYGLGGNDGLSGGSGNDRIWGGTGIDALFGGDGDDQLYAEAGDDYALGGKGNDFLHGGSGNDRLRGEDGNDTLNGGTGNDDLRGGAGNDLLIYEASGLVKAGTGQFHGDAGTDTLNIKAGGATVTTAGGSIADATAYINVDENAPSGKIGFDDRGPGESGSSVFVDVASFSGLERFSVSSDTRLDFFGGALSATVTGGNDHDRFFSGTGNETFNGGGSGDEFFFDNADGDVDRIVGFSKTDDVIVSTLWEDSQGTPTLNRTITESGGWTTVATTNDGELVHTILIDQVGIPLTVFKDGFSWG